MPSSGISTFRHLRAKLLVSGTRESPATGPWGYITVVGSKSENKRNMNSHRSPYWYMQYYWIWVEDLACLEMPGDFLFSLSDESNFPTDFFSLEML